MSIGSFSVIDELQVNGISTFRGSVDFSFAKVEGLPKQLSQEEIIRVIQVESVTYDKAQQIAQMEISNAAAAADPAMDKSDVLDIVKKVVISEDQIVNIAKDQAEAAYIKLPAGPTGFGIHATSRVDAAGVMEYSHGITSCSEHDGGYLYALSTPVLETKYSVVGQLLDASRELTLLVMQCNDCDFLVKIVDSNGKTVQCAHCVTIFAG